MLEEIMAFTKGLKAFMPTSFCFTAIFLLLASVVDAGNPDLFFNWNVSYAKIAPFGVEKQVIAINDQFPGPLLNVTTNDNVYVTVYNNLDEPFLLTWNGIQLRRNSWNDGVQGTNCPIPPGGNWTYAFQAKDQIGSFFYFPSVAFQKAAGGYGPIRINNRDVIPIPFDLPHDDYDIVIGDWYNADYKVLRASLDKGVPLRSPNGILINGLPPHEAKFTFQPGATYRLRISNVGLKTSINFQIQGHKMLLVEIEGSYTLRQYYDSLDIHVGQSCSVLVTADQPAANASYYMVATSRFTYPTVEGIAHVEYDGSDATPLGLVPQGPCSFDYSYSIEQARSIRWDLAVGAARPNPQGSFHYGQINISRTIVLQNDVAIINNRIKYTVNDVSFIYPDTPLKLADYFQIPGVFTTGGVPDQPDSRAPTLGTPIIDVHYKDFIQIVFQNNQPTLQSWHIDGYNFFVVGMDWGKWDPTKKSTYDMLDGVSRSTVQVYPFSWTAILLSLDNEGMWNIRSQDGELRYLGQEIYMRVGGANSFALADPRDEIPVPINVLKCGRASSPS